MIKTTLFATIKDAMQFTGALSTPSKMPCFGWSIPAQKCKTGSFLRNKKGSVCEKCYAMKGNYTFPNVKNALQDRLDRFNANPEMFVEAMVFILEKKKAEFFRWFDSGDLQSVEMLQAFAEIAKRLPNVKFWLPTKEWSIVYKFLKVNTLPENLNVRLSSYMIEDERADNSAAKYAKRLGVSMSSVKKEGYNCPASSQGNSCGNCRACWSSSVFNVTYKRH